MLGSRNPSKSEVIDWKDKNPHSQTGTFEQTAAFAELIVLSVSGHAAINAIELAGKDNFSGKVVIDTTNPISPEPPVNGVLKFFTDLNESLMERLQKELPAAKFVKAFNSVGSAAMYKPGFNEVKPTMFICGNDSEAKKTVASILEKFEWEVEDLGAVEAARAIEPLSILWCIPGFINNSWNHAFKLLKK